MNNFILAIGAGLVAVAYHSVLPSLLLGLVPAVLLAMLVTGWQGVSIDLDEWLWPAEVLLLLIAFVTRWPGSTVVLALIAIPILVVLFIMDLGTTPYPPLPPRR